jgi:hypothetical protein
VTYTEALYFVRQLAQETATPAPTIKTLALSVADLAAEVEVSLGTATPPRELLAVAATAVNMLLAMDYDALSYALFDYEAEQRRLSQPTGE